MTYDLTFTAPGGQPAPATDVWDRVVAEARTVLGDVDTVRTDESAELSHLGWGIQLRLMTDKATITVPYTNLGQATQVIGSVYALAAVVERETGLRGYDAQMGRQCGAAGEDLGSVVARYAATAELVARKAGNHARAAAARKADLAEDPPV